MEKTSQIQDRLTSTWNSTYKITLIITKNQSQLLLVTFIYQKRWAFSYFYLSKSWVKFIVIFCNDKIHITCLMAPARLTTRVFENEITQMRGDT